MSWLSSLLCYLYFHTFYICCFCDLSDIICKQWALNLLCCVTMKCDTCCLLTCTYNRFLCYVDFTVIFLNCLFKYPYTCFIFIFHILVLVGVFLVFLFIFLMCRLCLLCVAFTWWITIINCCCCWRDIVAVVRKQVQWWISVSFSPPLWLVCVFY